MKKLFTIFLLVFAVFLVTSSQVTANPSTPGTVNFYTPHDCYALAYDELKIFCSSGNLVQCALYTQIYHDQCNNAFDFNPEVLANFSNEFQFGEQYAKKTFDIINTLRARSGTYVQDDWLNSTDFWDVYNLPYPQTIEENADLNHFDGFNITKVADIMGAEADFFAPFSNDKSHIVDPSSFAINDNLDNIPAYFECFDLPEACTGQIECKTTFGNISWYNNSCHSKLATPTGEICKENSECVTNKCVATSQGKFCSCSTNTDCTQTANPSFCVIENNLGLCVEQSPAGTEVTNAGQCVDGLYDPATKKCFCELGTNSGCLYDDLCQNKYLCVENEAYNPAGGMEGSSCNENYECLSNVCENKICKCASVDQCQSPIAYCDSAGDKTCKDKKFAGQTAQSALECLASFEAGKCKCQAGGPEGCETGNLCNDTGITCTPDPSLILEIFNNYTVKNKKTNTDVAYCCKTDPTACLAPLAKKDKKYIDKFNDCISSNECAEDKDKCDKSPTACTTDFDCASMTKYCQTTAGVCIDKLPANAYCTSSNVCLSGSCQALKCTVPSASTGSGSSSLPGKGQNCLVTNGQCQPNLFCNTNISEYGLNVCVLLLGPDKKCNKNEQCISQTCQEEKCTNPTSEQILEMQAAMGETTETLTEEDFGEKLLGQSCTKYSQNNNSIDCKQNLFCNDETSLCAYQLGTGGECEENYYCLSNNCDTLLTQSCQPAVTATEPPPDPGPVTPSVCAVHTECPATMYCDFEGDKKCKDKAFAGTPCDKYSSAMCLDICNTDNVCTCGEDAHCGPEKTCELPAGTCKDKVALNGTCAVTADCISTAYCDAATLKCLALKASGGECTITEMCPKEHECKEMDISGTKKQICVCKKGGCAEGEFCSNSTWACTTKLDEGGSCVPGITGDAVCKSGKCNPDTGKCTKPVDIAGGGDGKEVKTTDLPDFLNTGGAGPYGVVGRVVSYLIGISGTIAFVIFVYGGILWLISAGRDDYIKKGQQAMVWAVIGLAVIFSSYIIIKFIVSLLGSGL